MLVFAGKKPLGITMWFNHQHFRAIDQGNPFHNGSLVLLKNVHVLAKSPWLYNEYFYLMPFIPSWKTQQFIYLKKGNIPADQSSPSQKQTMGITNWINIYTWSTDQTRVGRYQHDNFPFLCFVFLLRCAHQTNFLLDISAKDKTFLMGFELDTWTKS